MRTGDGGSCKQFSVLLGETSLHHFRGLIDRELVRLERQEKPETAERAPECGSER